MITEPTTITEPASTITDTTTETSTSIEVSISTLISQIIETTTQTAGGFTLFLIGISLFGMFLIGKKRRK